MEFEKLVADRRSIRAYKKGDVVTADMIEEMVKCAQQAPSWKNSQTGRYYVALSPEKLAQVQACLPSFNVESSKNAMAYVVTTFVKTRSGFERDGKPTNECGDEWGAYDLGMQNMLLQLKAREMGLDTLIMGIRDSEKLRDVLGISAVEEVMAVIALGYRDIQPAMPPRKVVSDITKIV